ncbi:MAG TPA: recombinase family protein [Arcobacter sp.]|nr:recombinase family protein [Arcobacter sp.]
MSQIKSQFSVSLSLKDYNTPNTPKGSTMKVGYARVSSRGQNLETQIKILKEAGCEKIFQEKKSGKSSENRKEFKNALDFVREGDILIVTRLDRFARGNIDLYKNLAILHSKGVELKATHQEFDTTSSHGRAMLGVIATMAEFEIDLKAERQAEGIISAKARGVKFGAKPKMTTEQVQEAAKMQKTGEMTNQQIADYFGVGRSTLLRYMANNKKIEHERN